MVSDMRMPERLLKRQIDAGKGSRDDRIRAARQANRLLTVTAIINGIAVVLNLSVQDEHLRTLWLVLGAFWLALSYALFKQRRYVNTLSTVPQVRFPHCARRQAAGAGHADPQALPP